MGWNRWTIPRFRHLYGFSPSGEKISIFSFLLSLCLQIRSVENKICSRLLLNIFKVGNYWCTRPCDFGALENTFCCYTTSSIASTIQKRIQSKIRSRDVWPTYNVSCSFISKPFSFSGENESRFYFWLTAEFVGGGGRGDRSGGERRRKRRWFYHRLLFLFSSTVSAAVSLVHGGERRMERLTHIFIV